MADEVQDLSVSQPYDLILNPVEWTNTAGPSNDPRVAFIPQFQMLPVGSQAFSTWIDGAWLANAPTGGPYRAVITVGHGQAAQVNPGVGTWRMWVRYYQDTGGQTPAFRCGIVTFSEP